MKRNLWRLADGIWLAAWVLYLLAGVPAVPFHGDESTLIHNTRDYAWQMIDHDLSRVTYNGSPAVDPMDQNLRLLDGRVHKYLGGFFWHLAGYTESDLNKPWLWGADWTYNQDNGHIPTDGLLVTTRYASAVLLAVGLLALFGIGLHVEGRVTAYAAVALFALHPALLLNGRRSVMEGALIGFTLLTVLAGMLWLRQRQGRPAGRMVAVLLLGLSAGMSLAAKHSGLLTVGPVFAALGMVALVDAWRLPNPAQRLPRLLRTGIFPLAAAGVLAVGIFYLFNPAWWGDPLARAREVAALRSTLLQDQITTFGGYTGFAQQVEGFWRLAMVGEPQYYEVADWAGFIGDQITAYEASPWAGIAPGGSLLTLVPFLLLLAAGVVYLLRRTVPNPAERWLAGVWIGGLLVVVFVVTPLPWQRYYLPGIVPLSLLVGVGVRQMLDFTRQLRQR